jgi:hypothetical protein
MADCFKLDATYRNIIKPKANVTSSNAVEIQKSRPL